MLGVAAMWAQEAQMEQAGHGPSAGYKRHWWIPKEGIEEIIRTPLLYLYFIVHLLVQVDSSYTQISYL
jgi:hypothetical protein